jgi:hypothetical protein
MSRARGFRVSIDVDSKTVESAEIGITYLYQHAQKLSLPMVDDGRLKPGEVFYYQVMAFRKQNSATPATTGKRRFEMEASVPPLPIATADLNALRSRATASGNHHEADLAVFIPQYVLDEVERRTRAADSKEIGGILLGHLCRDPQMPGDLFALVTAQIPAVAAESGTLSLKFTGETWVAVDAAIALRRSSEIRLGWYHCHSFWRAENKCEKQPDCDCPLLVGTFSADDIALHATVFPRAYSIGLLTTFVPCGELAHTLFGWKQGNVCRRGFHILPGPRKAVRNHCQPQSPGHAEVAEAPTSPDAGGASATPAYQIYAGGKGK